HQHPVAAGNGGGQVGGGTQAPRQRNAGEVTRVLVAAVDRLDHRRVPAPQRGGQAVARGQRRQGRAPRAGAEDCQPVAAGFDSHRNASALDQALPAGSAEAMSVLPSPCCAWRWRRVSAYRASKLIGCSRNGGKPPAWTSSPTIWRTYGNRMFGHWVPSSTSTPCGGRPAMPNTPAWSTSAT